MFNENDYVIGDRVGVIINGVEELGTVTMTTDDGVFVMFDSELELDDEYYFKFTDIDFYYPNK